MGSGRKDRPLVVSEHGEPATEIVRMIRTWFELGHDAEVGAEEAAPKLGDQFFAGPLAAILRSEEHTSELQSLMRNSYAVFCLKKKKTTNDTTVRHSTTE